MYASAHVFVIMHADPGPIPVLARANTGIGPYRDIGPAGPKVWYVQGTALSSLIEEDGGVAGRECSACRREPFPKQGLPEKPLPKEGPPALISAHLEAAHGLGGGGGGKLVLVA